MKLKSKHLVPMILVVFAAGIGGTMVLNLWRTEGEIGTDSAKLFVALYTGLPHTPEETTRLPTPALFVLREKLSETQLEEVKKKIVNLSGLKPVSSKDTEEHSSDQDRDVRGKTTFAELQDWELTKEEIEQVLGIPMGKPGVTVRDHCTENEIEFSEVKTALQALVEEYSEK